MNSVVVVLYRICNKMVLLGLYLVCLYGFKMISRFMCIISRVIFRKMYSHHDNYRPSLWQGNESYIREVASFQNLLMNNVLQ